MQNIYKNNTIQFKNFIFKPNILTQRIIIITINFYNTSEFKLTIRRTFIERNQYTLFTQIVNTWSR